MAAELSLTPVVSASDIETRVAELGAAISEDYAGRQPVLVAVLIGALPFLADLIRTISVPVDVDFLSISRFGEGGRIKVILDVSENLIDRDVVIVEDIVDTGLTLAVLRRMLADRGARSVATIALLDKTTRRLVDVPLEYRGFEVGDEYFIGYGLDYEGRYRNLPDLWVVLDPESLEAEQDEASRYLFRHQ